MGIVVGFRRSAFFGLLTVAVLGGVNEGRAAWVTYQADAAHTGYVKGRYEFWRAKLLWQTTVAPNAPNGLAVGDGTVFISVPVPRGVPYPNNPNIHALDQATGSVLWSKSFETATISAPAYFNSVVYFQTDGHTYGSGNFLNAYDARIGIAIFSAPYDAQWETYLNPTPFGENIYVGGGYYGGMYSFNASNGTRKWFGNVPQYDGWTPAVDGTYAYVYTGGGYPIEGVFSMLNVCDGTTAAIGFDPIYQWRGYTMNSAVVLGTNHDAFTINGGRLVAWDTTLDPDRTPHIRWSLSGGFSGQPSLANGALYVIANGGLSVLDETTGNTMWTWMPPSGSLIQPLIITDNLVFASTATDTFAINQRIHRAIWSHAVAGVLAFSNNRLYVAGSDGVVYAFGRGRMLADVSPMTTTTITMCPTTTTTTSTTTTTTPTTSTTTSTVTTTTIDFGPCTAARVGYSCGSSAAGCGCTVLCSDNCAPQCVIFASASPCQTDADCASISGGRCVADHPQACSATSGSCTFGVCLQPCTTPTTTSASTTTTTEPGPVCCSDNTGSCIYEPSTTDCINFHGTPGAAGTVCDCMTGTCTSPPATAGNCCENFANGGCICGPEATPGGCSSGGATFVGSSSVCSPSGTCSP